MDPISMYAAVDILSQHVEIQVNEVAGVELSPAQQVESDIAREKAISALNRTINDLDTRIDTTKTDQSSHSEAPPAEAIEAADGDMSALQFQSISQGSVEAMDAQPTGSKDASTNIKEAMSGSKKGLGGQAETLDKMATGMGPIIQKFDSVLLKPYLKNYSAVLNSVPVVGVKGDNIMYIKSQSSFTGIQDDWAIFGPLPAGANISSSNATHLFPYKGDLCLAVGTSIWRKRHRPQGDPELKQAVNQWPKLYLNDWEKVGDKCLPGLNLKSIVPFAVLSAARDQIEFRLLVLTQESSIQVLEGDDIRATNTFRPLTNISPLDESRKASWKGLAYWNDRVIAVDNDNNTWNLKMNFADKNFTAADKFALSSPISELTATDVGPVGVQSDGYLYRRVVEITKETQEGGDTKLNWKRWIPQQGVTHLGVASPGVMLDLHVLTKSLRSRYIETQTALYPVVNRLHAFGITHNVFLKQIQESATAFASSSDDKKKTTAITEGKKYAKHAMVWAKVLSSQTEKCKETVNLMSGDLTDVRTQLDTQLVMLRQRLVSLKDQLSASREAYKKLSAAFWGFIAVAILGLGIAIVCALSGVGTIAILAAGALFLGGIVAAIMIGIKMAALAESISDLQAQIRDVTTAIEELEFVVSNFKDLENLYGNVNQFWGTLLYLTRDVKTMDNVTAEQLGLGILEDTSTIDAAVLVTKQIITGTERYLSVLNACGITLPLDEDDMAQDAAASDNIMSSPTANGEVRQELATEKKVSKIFQQAQMDLEAGDFDAYISQHEVAEFSDLGSLLGGITTAVTKGMWFDPTHLTSQMGLFISRVETPFPMPIASELNATIYEARGNAVSMTSKVLGLADTAQEWTKKIPSFPETEDQLLEAARYQKLAVQSCLEASKFATQANNSFSIVASKTWDLQNEVQMRIAECNNRIDTLTNKMRALKEESQRPSLGWLSPWSFATKLGLELAANQKEIVDQTKLREGLSQALNSDISFRSQSQTWVEFCQRINSNLGSVYNSLTAIRLQLKEDPGMYREIMNIQWQTLRQNSREILQMAGISNVQPQKDMMALEGAQIVPSTTSSAIVRLLSPEKDLETQFTSQANDAEAVWASINKLQVLPWTHDIVAYWDEEGGQSVTLSGTIQAVRRSYVQIMATEYDAVQQLHALAIMQSLRAKNAARGRISAHAVLRTTQVSLQVAKKAANLARKNYAQSSSDLNAAVERAKATAKDISNKIGTVNQHLIATDKQQRDRVIGIIIHGALTGFATGALVAAVVLGTSSGGLVPALGGASAIGTGTISIISGDDKKDNGGKPSGVVPGSDVKPKLGKDEGGKENGKDEHTAEGDELGDDIEEKRTAKKEASAEKLEEGVKEAQKAWTTFQTIKHSVKNVAITTNFGRSIFGDVSIEALCALVAAIKGAADIMTKAVEQLETLQDPLVRLMNGVDRVSETLDSMNMFCDKTIREAMDSAGESGAGAGGKLYLTFDDAAKIEDAWQEVRQGAEKWFAVFDAQGISPISLTA